MDKLKSLLEGNKKWYALGAAVVLLAILMAAGVVDNPFAAVE
jgi:hypothetical protein